jgi:hypothetical protein
MKHSAEGIERITDAQMIFNTVYTHLIKQGGPSTIRGACMYRGQNGRMCAVGFMIPDDVYEENMEGTNALSLIAHTPKLAHLTPHMMLLRKMQQIHDTYAMEKPEQTWPEWIKYRFRTLAKHEGLDVSVLEAV